MQTSGQHRCHFKIRIQLLLIISVSKTHQHWVQVSKTAFKMSFHLLRGSLACWFHCDDGESLQPRFQILLSGSYLNVDQLLVPNEEVLETTNSLFWKSGQYVLLRLPCGRTYYLLYLMMDYILVMIHFDFEKDLIQRTNITPDPQCISIPRHTSFSGIHTCVERLVTIFLLFFVALVLLTPTKTFHKHLQTNAKHGTH